MKIIKTFAIIIIKIIFISLALILFFSMMAGMYYKSAPTKIKTAIYDEDQSPLSRSIIYNIKSSQYFDVSTQAFDYLDLQNLLDEGKADVGIIIPQNAYKDILNKRHTNLLAVINGTANPIVPKLSLMMLNKIIMTMNLQLSMKVRVEDLGAIPNVRHAKTPLISINERILQNPSLSMESSMLPAFMGLAMQIVSMLIVMFGLMTNFKKIKQKFPFITQMRQMPVKAIIPPYIISWIIVASSISIAYFSTMYLFHIPYNEKTLWNTIVVISLLVLAMETISFFFVLNIKNGAVLAAIITLIVMPAFMYSGFLIPQEQMANLPNAIGEIFPLRHYLKALYAVFNHQQELYVARDQIIILTKFTVLFFILGLLSILIGQFERNYKRKREAKKDLIHNETVTI